MKQEGMNGTTMRWNRTAAVNSRDKLAVVLKSILGRGLLGYYS